jgi:hypothetical protein
MARVIAVRGSYDDQPPLRPDRGSSSLGFREREPATVLRGRVENDGIRDRRATRMKAPTSIVVPMAGGALISKIHKGLNELERVGLLRNP